MRHAPQRQTQDGPVIESVSVVVSVVTVDVVV